MLFLGHPQTKKTKFDWALTCLGLSVVPQCQHTCTWRRERRRWEWWWWWWQRGQWRQWQLWRQETEWWKSHQDDLCRSLGHLGWTGLVEIIRFQKTPALPVSAPLPQTKVTRTRRLFSSTNPVSLEASRKHKGQNEIVLMAERKRVYFWYISCKVE